MMSKVKESKRIIIDTDPGVDDALAILFALKHPGLAVEAITTVAGNVGIAQTTRNALGILEAASRQDIPVYSGASQPLKKRTSVDAESHGDNGIGNVELPVSNRVPQHKTAAEFLVEHTANHPGDIALVAIGPLTNLAKAIEMDQTIVERVPELVIMGGSEGAGNMTPSAEFNFWFDPHAADIVMRAGFKEVTMVGLDATSQVVMSASTREFLKYIDEPLADLIHQITQTNVDFYWKEYQLIGAELCDVLALVQMVDDLVMDSVHANVQVCLDGLCEGRSVVARNYQFKDLPINARVGTTVNPRRFFATFLNTLFPNYVETTRRILDQQYTP